MSDALEIAAMGEGDAAVWDAFVEAHPHASFFHLWGWRRVAERSYGHEGVYLAARRAGRIVGVLPMIDVNSALFGRSLISTAFTVGGGIVADDGPAKTALAEAAIEAGRRRRARYVELRGPRPEIEGWTVKSGVYAGFSAPLLAQEDDALKAIPRKRRAEVRKAIEALEQGALAASWSRDAGDFYPLFAEAMREHGTPVFPRRFAAALLAEFGERAEVLSIRAAGTPVLSLLTFTFRDRVLPYYFGAGAKARANRAYDLAIWLAMRRGADKGGRVFDFGRSKYGTGSFDYKTHWGFAPAPLDYQYALIGAKETPNISPANPKFALLSAAWRRLPLPLANVAGPLLARHLA